MPASIMCAIAVPRLKYNHEPPNEIWCHSQALCIDRSETELLDELHKRVVSEQSARNHDILLLVKSTKWWRLQR